MEIGIWYELDSVNLIRYALYKDFNLPGEFDYLNLTQERILMTIKNSKNASMVQIARFIGLEKGPFSQVIDKLVKLGLVKRDKSATDKRLIHLNLTTEGMNVANRIQRTMNKHFNKVLSVLSRDEYDDFLNSLKTIHKISNQLLSIDGITAIGEETDANE